MADIHTIRSARSVFWRTIRVIRLALLAGSLSICVGTCLTAQTSYTSTSATGAWNTSRWNNSTDAAPYTSTYTANNNVAFTSGSYSFAGMGATTNVGNIIVSDGVSVNFASIGSTFATGGNVRAITVGTGSVFDFNGNSISTAAGTGLIKNGSGVFGTGAGTFTGGFTINAGTVIARGTTGFGSGATNILTLNGGTVASNNDRNFANTRFGGGIVVGGNVQFGELATIVSLASSSANLQFDNNVSLGSANRTLTLGNTGTQTFSGIISNTSGGVTFAANSSTDGGRFDITNSANTFTGNISITGGEVRFTANGSLGNAANDIVIDSGRFATADSATYTLGANRDIFVGDGAGTSISTPGAGTLTYNNPIQNKTGETGSWAKQGSGTLELGGVSTYSGATAINNGTVKLITGNDRLPTGTTVSLGQSASANLGTLDLNGLNQQIAGLNSVSGTNATTGNNTVTSATAATLTLGGSSDYSYGDGSDANSGVITGAISLVKNGAGTQTLGDTNTYTGSTMINSGTLQLGNGGTTGSLSTSSTITNNGTLTINRSNATTQGTDFSGAAITGTGSFVQAGSGTTTLNAANTYTGNTSVNAGKLVVPSAGSVDSSANAASTLTVSGGELQIDNSGSVTVGSTGTVSGGAIVTANGTLVVPTLDVSNGTLRGNGTVDANTTVGASSTLSPGTSIGELKVDGNLTVDGTYRWEVTSGSSLADLTRVIGNLVLTSASLDLQETGPHTIGQVFSLFAYTGTLTSCLTSPSSQWIITCGATSPGLNFAGDPTGFGFVNIESVPESNSLICISLAAFCAVGARLVYELARRTLAGLKPVA